MILYKSDIYAEVRPGKTPDIENAELAITIKTHLQPEVLMGEEDGILDFMRTVLIQTAEGLAKGDAAGLARTVMEVYRAQHAGVEPERIKLLLKHQNLENKIGKVTKVMILVALAALLFEAGLILGSRA